MIPMQTVLRPYYALSHVASQILGKNLPLSKRVLHTDFQAADKTPLEQWSMSRWKEFIHCETKNPSGMLPWITQYPLLTENFTLAHQTYEHISSCLKNKAKYILIGDQHYPRLLYNIPHPPIGLSVIGNIELLNKPCLSVVGSRKASEFSIHESRSIGKILCQLGITTISGGAYGCDIAAHQGVVQNNNPPFLAGVVFAGGLGNLYPKPHIKLFEKIKNLGGMLLSERLWDYRAKPFDFPIRNRIISGLSWELIVIQATIKSGAMVTVKHALDQGREVLTLRHSNHDVRASGNKQLIIDGAFSFADCSDLFISYQFLHESERIS